MFCKCTNSDWLKSNLKGMYYLRRYHFIVKSYQWNFIKMYKNDTLENSWNISYRKRIQPLLTLGNCFPTWLSLATNLVILVSYSPLSKLYENWITNQTNWSHLCLDFLGANWMPRFKTFMYKKCDLPPGRECGTAVVCGNPRRSAPGAPSCRRGPSTWPHWCPSDAPGGR